MNTFLLLQFIIGVSERTIDSTRASATKAQVSAQANLVLSAMGMGVGWLASTIT